jgi:hypothetical protein
MFPCLTTKEGYHYAHHNAAIVGMIYWIICRTLAVMHGNFDFKFVREILYSPPYNPGNDTLSSKMRVEIFTQREKNST